VAQAFFMPSFCSIKLYVMSTLADYALAHILHFKTKVLKTYNHHADIITVLHILQKLNNDNVYSYTNYIHLACDLADIYCQAVKLKYHNSINDVKETSGRREDILLRNRSKQTKMFTFSSMYISNEV